VRHVSLPDAKSLATLAESSQVEELEAALGEKDDDNGEIEGADEGDVQSGIKNAESALPDGAERKQHSERERGESIGDERNTSMNSSNKHTHGDVPEEDGSSSPSSLDTESEAVKAQKARQAEASEVEREMKQPSVEIKSIKREGAKRKSRRADDNDLGERELVASGLPREEIDAKLVLRALCRMALSDPDAGDDSFSSKARALALDLLRQLFFTHRGPNCLLRLLKRCGGRLQRHLCGTAPQPTLAPSSSARKFCLHCSFMRAICSRLKSACCIHCLSSSQSSTWPAALSLHHILRALPMSPNLHLCPRHLFKLERRWRSLP
jgi:hypothetical protein